MNLTERKPSKYKPVQLGGWFNHYHVLIICLFSYPLLGIFGILFADQIDEYFQTWQRQLFLVSVLAIIFLIWWLNWRLKNF